MKKFFALFTVIALLAVTGSAFAANPTITVDKTSVTVEAGKTATATVTTAPANGGTVSVSTSVAWATVSDTTVTFAPSTSVAANSYTVTLTATEKWTSGDVAGHHTSEEAKAEATVTVTVTPAPKPTPSPTPTPPASVVIVVPSTKPVTVTNVKVVNVAIANIVTKEDFKKTSRNEAAVTKGLSAIVDILSKFISGIAGNVSVRSANNITIIESSTYTSDNVKNMQFAAARLQNKGASSRLRAVGLTPPFSPVATGLQPIDLPKFNKAFYGKKPVLDLFARGKKAKGTSSTLFATAEDNGNEAVFLDSTGASTDVIPGENASNGAEAGVVTAVVYVEEGEEYDPVVAVELEESEVDAFDSANTTTESSVEFEETTYTQETVYTTDRFNPVVDEATRDAISEAYGKEVKELNYDAAKDGTVWSASTEEETYMTTNKMTKVCALPSLSNVDNGVYVVEVIFDTTPSYTTFSAPVFYADGVKEDGKASSTLYTVNEGTATKITSTNSKTAVQIGETAYLVFEVEGGAVKAAAEVKLSKPVLVVSETSETPTPVDPDYPDGPGGSSGGCSAGFSALALAVLGGFIATRRK